MPGWAPLTIALIEVYRFLSSEVKAYLPSYETVTVWHLRDLAMGVKKIIRCDDVKVIDVPQFEGLAIKDIFGYACNTPAVENALPPSKEIAKLCRGYLANVVYTLMGDPFQQWVNQQVARRNQKIAVEGNNMISMDPQIAQIFQQSTAISGKYLFPGKLRPRGALCQATNLLYSVERQVQPPDEGLGPEEEVPSPDRRGEAAGPAERGRDR
jgi:hypothetical protein